MIVAPNSPIARANARVIPARIPGHAIGSVIRRTVVSRLLPSDWEAYSSAGSTRSKAALAVMTTNGEATKV